MLHVVHHVEAVRNQELDINASAECLLRLRDARPEAVRVCIRKGSLCSPYICSGSKQSLDLLVLYQENELREIHQKQ